MITRTTSVRRLLPVLRRCQLISATVSPSTVSTPRISHPGTYLPQRPLSVGALHFNAPTSSDSTQRKQTQALKHGLGSKVAVPLEHFRKSSSPESHGQEGEYEAYTLPHPVWSQEELYSVQITHTPPEKTVDKAAYYSVQLLRTAFDVFSGYSWGKMFGSLDEKKWLTRIIYLETVAGVPGMIGAMVRHLKSLRRMTRDHGWIHTLLEEAENERMHLLTALELKRPGPVFKIAVIGTQGVFVTMFWVAYFLSPRFCHKFVGYLEEEAVKTYTNCLESLDRGDLKMWAQTKAPPIAISYWRLPADAMMRDVILAIRADEGHHREVNHTLGSMKPSDTNPYGLGK